MPVERCHALDQIADFLDAVRCHNRAAVQSVLESLHRSASQLGINHPPVGLLGETVALSEEVERHRPTHDRIDRWADHLIEAVPDDLLPGVFLQRFQLRTDRKLRTTVRLVGYMRILGAVDRRPVR